MINSEDTREQIRQAYGVGNNKRLVYIPDVYDNRNSFENPIFQEKERYCFIGGRANRDWELFIKLAESCPDIEFVAVSANKIWDSKAPNIEWRFDISVEEYYSLLKGAYIAIFPLKEERVSGLINIVKATQMGKLVLATDISAVTMYYPDNCRDSLLPIGNLEKWKNKLYEVFGYTEQEYTERIELMQNHIREKFSPDIAGKRLSQIINDFYGS